MEELSNLVSKTLNDVVQKVESRSSTPGPNSPLLSPTTPSSQNLATRPPSSPPLNLPPRALSTESVLNTAASALRNSTGAPHASTINPNAVPRPPGTPPPNAGPPAPRPPSTPPLQSAPSIPSTPPPPPQFSNSLTASGPVVPRPPPTPPPQQINNAVNPLTPRPPPTPPPALSGPPTPSSVGSSSSPRPPPTPPPSVMSPPVPRPPPPTPQNISTTPRPPATPPTSESMPKPPPPQLSSPVPRPPGTPPPPQMTGTTPRPPSSPSPPQSLSSPIRSEPAGPPIVRPHASLPPPPTGVTASTATGPKPPPTPPPPSSPSPEATPPPNTKVFGSGRRPPKRSGISAEVIKDDAETAAPPDRQPPPLEIQKELRQILAKSFLFSHLDEDAMGILVQSFWEVKKSADEKIIVQGEKGDNFYVISKGECAVYVKKGAAGPDVKVSTLKSGNSFGELSLMYNSPRAATVVAVGDVTLYALNRIIFNKILKSETQDKRAKWLSFLKKVPILENLTEEEQAKICDVISTVTLRAGEKVFSQGDEADSFYILTEGEAIVKKSETADGIPAVVKILKKGDYFGEMALLKNQPRAATVESNSCALLVVDRQSFVRLLGKCKDILERGMVSYESVPAAKKETSSDFTRRVKRHNSILVSKKNGPNSAPVAVPPSALGLGSLGEKDAAILEEEDEEEEEGPNAAVVTKPPEGVKPVPPPNRLAPPPQIPSPQTPINIPTTPRSPQPFSHRPLSPQRAQSPQPSLSPQRTQSPTFGSGPMAMQGLAPAGLNLGSVLTSHAIDESESSVVLTVTRAEDDGPDNLLGHLSDEISSLLSVPKSQFEIIVFSSTPTYLYVAFENIGSGSTPSNLSQRLVSAVNDPHSLLRKSSVGHRLIWGKTISPAKIKELQIESLAKKVTEEQTKVARLETQLKSVQLQQLNSKPQSPLESKYLFSTPESVAAQLREAEARERQAAAKLREAQAREKKSEVDMRIAESRQERLARELDTSKAHSARLEEHLSATRVEQENLVRRIKLLESSPAFSSPNSTGNISPFGSGFVSYSPASRQGNVQSSKQASPVPFDSLPFSSAPPTQSQSATSPARLQSNGAKTPPRSARSPSNPQRQSPLRSSSTGEERLALPHYPYSVSESVENGTFSKPKSPGLRQISPSGTKSSKSRRSPSPGLRASSPVPLTPPLHTSPRSSSPTTKRGDIVTFHSVSHSLPSTRQSLASAPKPAEFPMKSPMENPIYDNFARVSPARDRGHLTHFESPRRSHSPRNHRRTSSPPRMPVPVVILTPPAPVPVAQPVMFSPVFISPTQTTTYVTSVSPVRGGSPMRGVVPGLRTQQPSWYW